MDPTLYNIINQSEIERQLRSEERPGQTLNQSDSQTLVGGRPTVQNALAHNRQGTRLKGLLCYAGLAILFGLMLLVWSADRFIEGAAATAQHLGVPSLLIGMVTIGFGLMLCLVYVAYAALLFWPVVGR